MAISDAGKLLVDTYIWVFIPRVLLWFGAFYANMSIYLLINSQNISQIWDWGVRNLSCLLMD